MKNAVLMSVVFFISGLFILVGPASSAQKNSGQKGIGVTNFIETTERSYLFVYPSEEKNIQSGNKKRISVTTQCSKPASAGAEAKKCVHKIEIQPGNSGFTLNTGDEVVMIDLPGDDDPLMLGSIECGYEDGPDVIRLYNEKGKYLGSTMGIDLIARPDPSKIMAQPYYLKNAVEDDGKYYIILTKEGREGEFETMVLKKGAEPQRVPFAIAIPDKDKCSEWYIDEFVKNGEGLRDLVIKLKGVSCSGSGGTIEKYLKCSMAQ